MNNSEKRIKRLEEYLKSTNEKFKDTLQLSVTHNTQESGVLSGSIKKFNKKNCPLL